jgi:hypothetical protein
MVIMTASSQLESREALAALRAGRFDDPARSDRPTGTRRASVKAKDIAEALKDGCRIGKKYYQTRPGFREAPGRSWATMKMEELA